MMVASLQTPSRRRATCVVWRRYHAYLDNQGVIDKVYNKYDSDGSGSLERDELVTLLRAIASDPDATRLELGMGVTPYAGVKVEITEEDLEHVLEVGGRYNKWGTTVDDWRESGTSSRNNTTCNDCDTRNNTCL